MGLFGKGKEPEKRHYQPDGEEEDNSQVCHYCGDTVGMDSIDQHESTCVKNPYRDE